MKHPTYPRFSLLRHLAAGAVAAVSVAACATSQPPSGEPVSTTSSAVWTNGGFEIGAAGSVPAAPWTVQTFINPGITVQTPQTRAGLNLAPGGAARTVILSTAAGPMSQTDPTLGAAASLRWPRYGNQCAIVNGQGTGNNRNVNSLSQTMTVGAGDVDPSDGKIHVRFAVAPVLQNPVHTAVQQPYYMVQVTNVTQGNALIYSDFNLSGAGITWKTLVVGGVTVDYTDWQLVDVAPGGTAINQGDQLKLEIIAAGCSLGAHFGQIYVDGVGATVPGVNVEATGPAQANACSNITYTLDYKNGSAAAETGVVVDFTTPTQTTYQSISAPGLACVTPAVGAAGTVTCTVGNLAAGASGSFTVTVNIGCAATGTIVAGNYDIHSTQENEPLNGPKVITTIGCAKDSDCTAGNWCDETLKDCTATLPNGTAIPTDPLHTNPTLNGVCTAQAGAVVCTSGVCDTADNECGYAIGDGPCTVANGGTVCRSGACSVNGKCEPAGGCNVDADCTGGKWCTESTHTCTSQLPNGTLIPTDPPHTNPTLNSICTVQAGTLVCQSGVCDTNDNKCGYANGDGPCTVGTGGTVCRSGTCSVNGTCEPAGGCNVDADCTGGQWCAESTHTCMAQLPNGTLVPTDPAHTNPTLNGTCTTTVGTLVCVSGVCDTNDNECGYANGDGPCTMGNGGTVCRSGTCSSNGTCEPAGGCNVDSDCTGGMWCNEAAHTCAPQIANGGSVPTDPAHTNPTLDGTCTATAGTLVCQSGVCDTRDNECGYANGDGPCTMGNGGTVCRSGMCSSTGTCEPSGGCNVDADCSGGQWCDETAHACKAKLANGTSIPTDGAHTNPTLNGTCTAAAGTLVCASGVCDTHDNECGYANGDGPCTPGDAGAAECRSGVCNSGGTCGPGGGDAGTDGGPGMDAGGTDAGDGGMVAEAGQGDSGRGADAGEDATVADASGDVTLMGEPDADQGGSVAGGGLSCTMGRGSGEPRSPLGVAGVLVGIAMALGARRRRAA